MIGRSENWLKEEAKGTTSILHHDWAARKIHIYDHHHQQQKNHHHNIHIYLFIKNTIN